jgi:asparagine synthase (glutamine-hydrolysing)
MCGIGGLFYFDRNRVVDESVLANMRDAIDHRGPDDRGLYRKQNVGFAFNRLSIIDLIGGHQPMPNRDGTAWIIFNGEIYNYVELRQELTSRGYRFRTRSDTESILHAWDHYGEECVNHLRGMFAFAIWDERKNVLFLARDRIGIKPLYYYLDDGMFAFASEIKSLLQVPGVAQELDTAALAEYLRHGYVLTPRTIFRHVHKVPPAHSVTVTPNGPDIRRYWEVPLGASKAVTEAQAGEELDALLKETVGLHLAADVPIGVFLSGGVDSSSVVATMSRLGVRKLRTFSIGYESPESELQFARIVATRYATEHKEVHLTPSAFVECLPEIAWHMDEPIADAPAIPLFCLSRVASEEVSVALSGEGADEIFGGYPAYRRNLWFDRVNRLPFSRVAGQVFERFAPDGKLRKNGSMLGRPLEKRYRTEVIFPLRAIARLLPDEKSIDDPYGALAEVHRRCSHTSSLSRMTYVDLTTWLPNDLLLKADRMTMAHSLELRVPFLDHKLVEFAARLPSDLKIRGTMTKYLLKRRMEPFLPQSIVHRRKRGFSIPTKEWFRNSLSEFVHDSLMSSSSPCAKFFSKAEIAHTLKAHRNRDCSLQIYALLVFNEWYRAFFERPALEAQSLCFSE